jgi:NAD-dependent deacetylase
MVRDIESIAHRLRQARVSAALTGAGVSRESGMPTFSGPGGIYERYPAVTLQEFLDSREVRIRYWQRTAEVYRLLRNAAPGSAHAALSDLYRAGVLEAVITQNMDGLHQAAGLPDQAVIELHGSYLRTRCLRCGTSLPTGDVLARVESGEPAPECGCGGFLKPDTVSFGQHMPEEATQRAMSLASRCGCLLVAGSAMRVHPAARLPVLAKERGAYVALLNLSKTPVDAWSDVVLREEAGRALSSLAQRVRRLKRQGEAGAP